jgi:hypothetical protein
LSLTTLTTAMKIAVGKIDEKERIDENKRPRYSTL